MKSMFENSYVIYNKNYSYSQVNARGREIKGSFSLEKDKINITLSNGSKSANTYKIINDELIISDTDFAMIFKRDTSFVDKNVSTDKDK